MIVFHPPGVGDVPQRGARTEASVTFIKRVVGLPGETVQAVGGHVLICRAPASPAASLSEPYARSFTDDFGPVIVPRDAYFVLGDNRVSSEDSRIWGTLPDAQRDRHGVRAVLAAESIRHPLRMGWLRSRSSVQLALTVLARARAGLRRAALPRRHLPRAERLDGAHAAAGRPAAGRALLVLDRAADARRHRRAAPERAGRARVLRRHGLAAGVREAHHRPARATG